MSDEKPCILRYNITEDPSFERDNQTNLKEMKQLLADVGIFLWVEDGKLTLSKSSSYERKKTRYAGRRKTHALKDEFGIEAYRYADIVCMMQSMMDKDIAERIKMPIATFYRHKKKLVESSYYNSLDKDRLSDLQYLNSVDGNYSF